MPNDTTGLDRMKKVFIGVLVSAIFVQSPGETLSQVFPVDLESLKKERSYWLNPESMEVYDGAVYKMEEGEIVFKGHLRNGLFHGRYEEYHPKVDSLGSRGYERGTYEEGHREGGFEVYESVGKLSEKGRYLRGVRHGPYLAYHDNMSLWIKTEYIEGRWEGPYESFDRNGKLVAKGRYKKNLQCGLWIQEGKMVEYPSC